MKELKKGFTIIELAIVVVVIGVIVGMITSGKALVNSGKVVTIISELQYYKHAQDQFIQKYKYRPGDVSAKGGNASPLKRFFAGNSSDPHGCADTSYLGDGKLDGANDDVTSEEDLAWLQLSYTGLIDKKIDFDFCDNAAPAYRDPGVHRPLTAAADGVGYTFMNEVLVPAYREGENGVDTRAVRVIRVGAKQNNTDKRLSAGGIPIRMHKEIDAKIDQPNTPTSGIYVVSENCFDRTAVTGTLQYLPDSDKLNCVGNMAEFGPKDQFAGVYCPTGYSLQGGMCVKANGAAVCPIGYVMSGGSCHPAAMTCPPGYTLQGGLCISNTLIQTCAAGYEKVGSDCLAVCPNYGTPDAWGRFNGVCIPQCYWSVPPFIQDPNTGACNCPAGYASYWNGCRLIVPSCLPGFNPHTVAGGVVCVNCLAGYTSVWNNPLGRLECRVTGSECPTGQSLLNGECVNVQTHCPTGYALDNGQCTACATGYVYEWISWGHCIPIATSCNPPYRLDSGVCLFDGTLCPPGTNAVNSTCVSQCPTGYTYSNGVCSSGTNNVLCPDGYTMQSNGTCQSNTAPTCPNGYTLNGGLCVSNGNDVVPNVQCQNNMKQILVGMGVSTTGMNDWAAIAAGFHSHGVADTTQYMVDHNVPNCNIH